MEPRLHQLFQMHGHHRLSHPVCDRRHAEHSDPAAVRLGDLHCPAPGAESSDPELIRFQILYRLSSRSASNSSSDCPSTPGAPLFAATRLYASHTIGLGISNGLSWALACSLRFLPGPRPRLNEPTFLDEPAPSLHPHPSEQELHSYYEPVRQRAPHRYSMPSVSASARSLSRPATRQAGRIDARLLTFRARAADQDHAASTPGTTWPIHGHPPGSSRRKTQDPRFRCHLHTYRRLNSAHPTRTTGRAFLERLPGPHLTRSSHAFSLVAHHDGLQPTQHRAV